MRKTLNISRLVAVSTVGAFAFASVLVAQQAEEKPSRHHRFSDLLKLFSDEERAKFKAAKERAMKDPAVRAAREKRDKADEEYRELLHAQMVKIDPSVKPLIDKTAQLKKRRDY